MIGQDQSRTETDQLRPVAGIVLDVDGTLLDPAHRLSPANVAAVARARAAGLHVLLASGRSARALRGRRRARSSSTARRSRSTAR